MQAGDLTDGWLQAMRQQSFSQLLVTWTLLMMSSHISKRTGVGASLENHVLPKQEV